MNKEEIVKCIYIFDREIEKLEKELLFIKTRRTKLKEELAKQVDNVEVEEFLLLEEIRKGTR